MKTQFQLKAQIKKNSNFTCSYNTYCKVLIVTPKNEVLTPEDILFLSEISKENPWQIMSDVNGIPTFAIAA